MRKTKTRRSTGKKYVLRCVREDSVVKAGSKIAPPRKKEFVADATHSCLITWEGASDVRQKVARAERSNQKAIDNAKRFVAR